MYLPATGGPTVSGIEQKPKRKPIACDAPLCPTTSNAIGPNNEMKQPSNKPKKRHKMTRKTK